MGDGFIPEEKGLTSSNHEARENTTDIPEHIPYSYCRYSQRRIHAEQWTQVESVPTSEGGKEHPAKRSPFHNVLEDDIRPQRHTGHPHMSLLYPYSNLGTEKAYA